MPDVFKDVYFKLESLPPGTIYSGARDSNGDSFLFIVGDNGTVTCLQDGMTQTTPNWTAVGRIVKAAGKRFSVTELE